MRYFLIAITAFFSVYSSAQVRLKRNGNSTLAHYASTHPAWNTSGKQYKWGRTDTLKLPFFDDFTTTRMYPDSTKWFNNQVFVNNDFPVKPPSYGVATFDDLDSKGNPYQSLNENAFGGCDTLLSLPINLYDSSGKRYFPSDSVYLSFYFQRQGLGDPSDSKDSLVLQLKDSSGAWKSVWKATGGLLSPFEMVMINISRTKYFHKGFQFRFMNYSRRTGNMNQWHVDYIHLARNRRKAINYYNDFAVQSRPVSLLKYYFQMPYDHFLADPVGQATDSIFFYASNLGNTTLNIEARHIESWKSTILRTTNFVSNAANITAGGNARRRFPSYDFKGLSGDPVVIKREYFLRESGISSRNPVNDQITVYQEFNSCYAYDDGTAEYGFGYDDDVIDPFYKGAVAYRFDLTKPDTLWGIGMFFNQSVKSSAALRFTLKVWKKISPVGSGRNQDVEIYSLDDLLPRFTDSLNGFHVFYLDTQILLPKGEFYIGWEQVGNNHLDVGYDINNGYHGPYNVPNLFWADRGNWKAVSDFPGALMMRPYVGKRKVLGPAGVKPVQESHTTAGPNPFGASVHVTSESPVTLLRLINIQGLTVAEAEGDTLDTSMVPPGIYTLWIQKQKGVYSCQKMVKLQ